METISKEEVKPPKKTYGVVEDLIEKIDELGRKLEEIDKKVDYICEEIGSKK